MSAQLELKTSVLNARQFLLFDQEGATIDIPADQWKSSGDYEDPDQEINLPLDPGVYWLVTSNINVTDVIRVCADETAVKRCEVGCVANGFPGQVEEIGKVATSVPRTVFDLFLELGQITREGFSP